MTPLVLNGVDRVVYVCRDVETCQGLYVRDPEGNVVELRTCRV